MAESRKDFRVEDLSALAQTAVATKKASGRKRIKEWKQLIDELAEFDATTDRLQARARNFMILGIVLAVIGGIVTAFAFAGQQAALGVLALVVALASVGLAIYHGARWNRFRTADLDNDFRLCLAPLLDVMADDLERKERVRIDLDMAGISKAKMVKQHDIPPGRFKKVTETIYHDPWCHLAARLADGSQLILDIENQFTEHDRRWTARSRSGKYKFKRKRKWKKLVVVSATVAPNSEHLEWNEPVVAGLAEHEKLKLAEKKGAHVCRLVRKFKFSAVNEVPTGVASAKDIMGMFMELFAMLNPAGARS